MKFDLFLLAIAGGLFLIFLVLIYLFQSRFKTSAALRYSSIEPLKAGNPSWRVRLRWIPLFLRICSLFLLLIAFSRPQKGLEIIRTSRQGIAIQIVIDRSSSMKKPLAFKGRELDRLSVVKLVLDEFVTGNNKELKGRPNDMIGLNSFAGFVEENSPLTLDHITLVNFAKTIRPASKIEDGTMIGDAIYYSVLRLISVDDLLRKAGEKDNDYAIQSKIIILLTDGQQTRGGMNPLEAAKFAESNGIKIYTIAITGEKGYARQNSIFGQFFSLMDNPLDTSLLEQVAETTGGIFAKASSGEALVDIYRQIDALEKSEFDEHFTSFKEVFPLFVTLGLLLLILEQILSHTVFRKIP
jgi:Ca-activated chloride channel homolog